MVRHVGDEPVLPASSLDDVLILGDPIPPFLETHDRELKLPQSIEVDTSRTT